MGIAKFTSTYRGALIKSIYKKWLKQNEKILDIGCGTGIISLYLADNLSVQIIGCDVKNYLSVPIPFIRIQNSYKLPFEKNSFDSCMLNDVLHHLEKSQQKRLIKETLRISSKVLIFEMKKTFSAKVFDIMLNKFHYGDLKTPLSFRNKAEWIKIFNNLSVKYQIIELKKPFWYPFSHIAILLTK